MKPHPMFTRLLVALLFALGLALPLHAQVTTSGITGVVRGSDGRTVAGAAVKAVHQPTNAQFTATSNAEGRFYFRSLPVGGPYSITVTAANFGTETTTDVTTQLGTDIDVNFSLTSGVTTMEKFVVSGERSTLDSNAQGAGTFLTSERLGAKPTTQRSLADVISASSFVTLRALSGDREEAQISAVGQNARYNSIMIDGARINDQFGLNMTGLASFFNPLSLDTIEQLSVSVSPYDVRQSGFTGAAVNAVTKSGTNRFSGSAYYIFSGNEWLGYQMQGEDVQTRAVQGRKVVPVTERTTWGATLGGPILKNRLFFFASYEKFERLTPPNNPGFTPLASEIAAIQSRFAAINAGAGRTIDWGQPGGSAINLTDDEKIMAKLDWQVTKDHRLSVRYSTTEGQLPQYGGFTATSGARGVNPTPTGPGFAFDSYFYAQERREKVTAGQFVSQWTPNLKTEFKYSTTKQDQLTPTKSALPLINILNVNGISQSGTPTTGILFLGTEFSRHGNQIFVDTKSYSGTAEYFRGNFVFTGGFDREESDFVNLFRSGSYGQFDFNGTAGFTAGTVAAFNRSMYDPSVRPAADLSNFAVTGLFGQVKWDVSRRLSLVGGVRFDMTESGNPPLFNQKLFGQTGFRNTGTIDGVTTVSPRVGVNWSVDEERKLQVRGGVGRFLGRSPWVFFSNSYNQLGVGTFTITTAPASLEAYLRSGFDPANPIGSGPDTGTNDREVDWTDDKIKLPSVWRGNAAVDYRLPFLDTVATVELVQTYNDKTFFIRNENLRPAGTGADGRPRFSGSPSLANNATTALYPDFLNLYRIRNISTGESRYVSLTLDRPMKNRWAYNFSYTRGRATDAQIFGSTTAGSQFGRNPVFYQNEVVEARSDFEVRDRFQLTYTREFNLLGRALKRDARDRGARTLVSLYYEGRTGSPYSWVYSNDMNGDGISQNDLVAVPSNASDPRFNFTGMSADAIASYFAFLNESGLSRYAGGFAPRNAYSQPWVNRLDLKISQHIPLFSPAQLEVFLDFTNFGSFVSQKLFNYYERTTLVESDTFWRRSLGTATYDATGRIQLASNNALSPTGFVYDNPQSRWRIQVGARLKF
ncbi:MAG: TonB-dependent receptor [Opitutaceae bacterium]|nr:TonB-dependent receptor [Opitutaceae bacterium]